MKKVQNALNVLGQLVAFLTIILYVVLIANANWPFIAEGSKLLYWLELIKGYSTIILLCIVAFEASCKQNFIIKVLIYVCIAVVIIFQFFPETAEYLTKMLNDANKPA